jgi:uncharacterized protein (TIGR02246 family)
MADEKRAVRDMVATWMKASEAGDLSTVLSLMADDVIFMTPDREPFGKDAFRASSEAMKGVSLRGTSDIREIEVLGDWAYIRNYIDVTLTPSGGQCGAAKRIHALDSPQTSRRKMVALARCEFSGLMAIKSPLPHHAPSADGSSRRRATFIRPHPLASG